MIGLGTVRLKAHVALLIAPAAGAAIMPADTHRNTMKPRSWFLLVAAVLLMAEQGISAPLSPHWRSFKKEDGLADNSCVSVTIGAAGNLLIQHGKSSAISVLDGYEVTVVPGPDTGRNRVYESPGGQLWTTAPEGLKEFRDGEWVLHFVSEVAVRLREGFTNPVPLLPVRQGRVLALLPDRLLQFAAEDLDFMQVELVLHTNRTRLGAFREMAAARDGGLLIAGEHGIARLAGPLRNLKTNLEPREFIPLNHPEWQNFSALHEEESGAVTALAETAAGEMVLARLENEQWSARPLKLDKLRFAWRGQGRTWAVTTDSLYELRDGEVEPTLVDEIAVRRIFDVAVEPTGAFFLATSEGMFRYAPLLWENLAANALVQRETNSPLPALPEEIARRADWKAFLAAKNGDWWLGAAREIAWRHQNTWKFFASTNQIEPENVLAFGEAPDGRIRCATPEKIWEFDGKNWLPLRGGFDRINAMYSARDGALWIATANGLHCFSQGSWIGYGLEDGLPSEIVRGVFADELGRVVADTLHGFSVYQPVADPAPPRTFIRTVANEDLRFGEGDIVDLSFAGWDKWKLTEPGRLLFSHRLDEREWSPFLESREVSFADLELGKHRFLVRAMDRAGNVDQKPALLAFSIVMPWYRETRLVLILSAGLIMALFFAALAFNRHRKLRRAYAEVEKKIAERTRELEVASRELLHGQKMNALGTLAAGIAHDFNNILSIIKGSAQIIEDNLENPEKIRTRADRIKTVVQQGAGIVEAMLGFSRNSEQQTGPCDVNVVVADTVKLLGDRFLREVQVRFEPGEDLPEIPVARDFVQQVLLNLIFNAAESMSDRKQIVVTVRRIYALPSEMVLPPARADSYIVISVKDSGSGITAENLPRIFEPFFTTKAMSARRGTGLGLSMVYELAKKLEAGLVVESVVGQGSTFSILLPVPLTPNATLPRQEELISISKKA